MSNIDTCALNVIQSTRAVEENQVVGKSEEIKLSWKEDISKSDVNSQPEIHLKKDDIYVHSK